MSFINIPGSGAGSWKGSVATSADLPSTGNFPGDARTAQDSGIVYVWDGGAWIAQSGGSISGPFNQLTYFDGTGTLTNLPGFQKDTTSGGLNESLTENPNNIGGGFTLNNYSLNIDPLQNSPNDYWTAHGTQINLDANNSGFTQGTNGTAGTVFNNYINNNGTGNTGAIAFTQNSFDIGNGTDPITFKGLGYSFGFGQVHANATIDGTLQGYGFQPAINAAAAGTSAFNIQCFFDSPNVGITVNGYTAYNSGPSLFGIANNTNYTAFVASPNITTLNGNAGVFGLAFGGNYTTTGATSSITAVNSSPIITTMGANANLSGLQCGPQITTMGASSSYTGVGISGTVTTSHGNISGITIGQQILGGDASYTGINISPYGGATLTDPVAININLSGVNSTNPQGSVGIQSDSRLSINATTQLKAAQGFQIGSRIENLFTVPAGSPVTGTDELGVNIAGDFLVQDDVANGAFGIGFNSVGFIASLAIAATKTADTVTVFLPACALPDPGFATGGNITEFHVIRSFPPLPQGGTVNITNAYFLKLDSAFGDFAAAATNAWGLYIDSTAENYIASSIAIGTASKKVTNSSVALEIGGTTKAVVFTNVTTVEKLALTALPGMQVFDTTLNQMSYYNGTTWINF